MSAPGTGTVPATAGWRILPLEDAAPRTLLGRSADLLDALADDPVPTLRWYRATSTAIVLGRGQGGRGLPAGAPAGDLEVLHRPSGGGAVLLSPDLLSLDVALPAGHPLLEGLPAEVFLPVGRAWAAALADLGVPGTRVHRGPAPSRRSGSARERLLAAICYATLGHGEVAVAGRKIVGLAQRRRRHGALVQCGLLRRWRPGPLLAALGADPGDRGVANAAVGLDDLGCGHVVDDAVVARVCARLAGKDAADG